METLNIFPTPMETWVRIKGHTYEASSEGRIRSLPKQTRKGTRVLRQILHPVTGYLYLSLVKSGKSKNCTVHRLICGCFHGPAKGRHTNHKNGVKTDNRAINLEWSTVSENRLHAFRTGLQSAKGTHNSQAKLNADSVIEIRSSDFHPALLALRYNVSVPTIHDIKKRRSWAHI